MHRNGTLEKIYIISLMIKKVIDDNRKERLLEVLFSQ